MDTQQTPAKKTSVALKLAYTALLAALVIVFQIWCVIPLGGGFNITLSLVPIVVGAILLGWQYGLALGAVLGIVVSILSITGQDPSGAVVFQMNPAVAWIMCILKSSVAGAASGLVYRLFTKVKCAPYVFTALSGAFLFLGGFGVAKLVNLEKTWQQVLLICGCALIAVVYMILAHRALSSGNTGVFLAAMVAPICNTGIFVLGISTFFTGLVSTNGFGAALVAISVAVFVNFIIELSVSVILAPAIATIVKAVQKDKHFR